MNTDDTVHSCVSGSRLSWSCMYCGRKTSFHPGRLVYQSTVKEPLMGLVIVNRGVVCTQCMLEVDDDE